MPSSPIWTKCSYRVPLSIYFSLCIDTKMFLTYIDSTKRIRYKCRTYWASQLINLRCTRYFLCISYSPETRLESRIIKEDFYFILSFIKLSLFHSVHTVWNINQSLLSEYGPDHRHPAYYSCAIQVDPFHIVYTVWHVNQSLLSEYGPDHRHPAYYSCVIYVDPFHFVYTVRYVNQSLLSEYGPDHRHPAYYSCVIYVDPFHFVYTVWYVNQSLLSEYGPDHRHPVYYSCAIYVDPFHFVLTVWYVNQGLLSEYMDPITNIYYIIHVPFTLTLSISCTLCVT